MNEATEKSALRLRFDVFELDEREARVRRDVQPLQLQPKALAVLCALARRPGQLVTKSELLDAVWGHRFVTDSVLKSVISDLRAALGDDARQPRFIETASRRGYYRLIAVATPVSDQVALPKHAVPTVVGREAARQRLAAAWATAAEGRRQVVWISGEPGIGNTTLIELFAESIGPARVALGQCVDQHGASEPYMPVLEAVADRRRTEPQLSLLLRAVAPTWWLQLPWLGSESERDTLRRELAGSGPERMLREFGEWLDRASADQPLLLVTEDLHWSDPALASLPALSIDHLDLSLAGLPTLLWLAERGVHVKASGFGRVDFEVAAALRQLDTANPHALMFGTDHPSTRAPRPYRDGDFALVREELDEAGDRRVLHENALRFYSPVSRRLQS